MRKLLVICGPTATGKTSLAVYLSKVTHGQIISADSRQVYKYMEIGTGKERPRGADILGYDLVNPDEEFSVKSYIDFVNPLISEIYKKGKLPILVGGTGLYIKAVVDGIETLDTTPNKDLREELAGKSVSELFAILNRVDPIRVQGMNESDRKNPRRLTRAIEIAKGEKKESFKKPKFDSILMIGLTCDREVLKQKIERRVDERIKAGFEKEYNFIKGKGLLKGVDLQTLGYKDWPDIEKWKTEEYKYAKRQMTWFKKDKRIKWFDITKPAWKEKMEQLVKKWYSLN